MHPGSWFGLPDFGLTEWAGSLLGANKTNQGGSDILPNTPTNFMPTSQVQGMMQPNGSKGPGGAYPVSDPSKGTLGSSTSNVRSGGGGAQVGNNLGSTINNAANSQQNAAQSAADAAQQAAERAYSGAQSAANTAKQSASDTYNWLIDTLGSNKKDTLNQITTNENQNLSDYATQQGQTQQKYDQARQDILSTYRDLNLNQEKILRGSGQGQSSTGQEAQLRLNNLMGKDLSSLSTQNADAMAVIGNAISAVKQKATDLMNSVETQTQSQLDKAAIDYKNQVAAIDQNLQLAGNQRADALNAAAAKLQADTANIQSWAAGLKVQAAQLTGNLTDQLNQFITGQVTANGQLSSDLNTAQQNTDSFVQGINNTSLTPGAQSANPQPAVQQKSTNKSQLDQLLASGQITQAQYDQQLAQISGAPQTLAASLPSQQSTGSNGLPTGVQNDPLLAAIFNRGLTA